MSSFPNPDEHEVPTIVGRRSTRLSMIIPIAIKGTSGDGQAFKENTWTIGINKQGARIASFHRLTVGDEIVIENPLLGHTARARVIRVGEKRFPEDPYEVGVELLESRNVWGVKFPPEDWKAGPGATTARERTLSRPTAVDTAVRQPQPPPAERTPAPTEPTAPEKSAQFNMAIKALSQLAKETETVGSVPPESEHEAPPPAEPSGGKQDAVEAATAKPVSDEQARLVERQVASLAEQVRGAHQGVDALVEKLHDFQEHWDSEISRVREQAGQAAEQALASALAEAREQAKRDADAAAWKSLDDARRRIEDEARRSTDAFRENAAQAASRVLDDRIAGAGPLLDALVASSAERVKEAIDKKAEDLEPELKAAAEKTVEKLADSLLARTSQAVDERVQSALGGLQHSLDEALAKRLEEIHAEGDRVAAELKAVQVQAAEVPAKALTDLRLEAVNAINAATDDGRAKLQSTVDTLDRDIDTKMEDFRGKLGSAATVSLDGFQNYLGDIVKNFEEQLQKTARERQAEAAEQAAAEVKKSTAGSLEAARNQFQKQAEDFLDLFNHELLTAGQKNMEQVRAQIYELGRAAAEQLTKDARAREAGQALLEANAQQVMEGTSRELARAAEATVHSLREAVQRATEDYRTQLHNTLDESVKRSTRDLESFFNNILEGRRASVAAEIQKQADEAGARAAAEMKNRAEAAAKDATDQVLKQVGLATMVLKDWGDQATARMESTFQKSLETFKARVELIASSTAEEQRRRSAKTTSDLLNRLKHATQALESSESPEPSPPDKAGR